MAFSNYLGPDTYSAVDGVQYEKMARWVRWHLHIFKDASKTIHLASKEFEVTAAVGVWGAKTLHQSTRPTSPAVGDSYVIAKTSSDPLFSQYPAHLAKYTGEAMDSGNHGWDFWYFAPGQVVYVESEQKHYEYSRDTQEFRRIVYHSDERIWNRFFTPELVMSQYDPYAQIYKYMKTLPGFENVGDI